MELKGDYKPGAVADILSGKKHVYEDANQTQPTKKRKLSSVDAKAKKRKSEESANDAKAKKHTSKDKTLKLKKKLVNTDVTPDRKQTVDKPKTLFTSKDNSQDTEGGNSQDNESGSKTVSKKKTRPRRNRRKRSEEAEKRTIFIGNLPKSYKRKDVEALFKSCGKVESSRIRSAAPADPKLPRKAAVIKGEIHEQRTNVNAYIVFQYEDAVEDALELNGKDVSGHIIRVDRSSKVKQHREKCSVFVGNLPFDVHEDKIREHFIVCGGIDYIRVIRDQATGLGKGFGYVSFQKEESVPLAIKLNGQKMGTRELRVKSCLSDDDQKKTKKKKLKALKRENDAQLNRKQKVGSNTIGAVSKKQRLQDLKKKKKKNSIKSTRRVPSNVKSYKKTTFKKGNNSVNALSRLKKKHKKLDKKKSNKS